MGRAPYVQKTRDQITADFSSENGSKKTVEWIIQYWKGKKIHEPRSLYPAELSFESKGGIKAFSDKQELRKFIASRPALQEILKEVIQRDVK